MPSERKSRAARKQPPKEEMSNGTPGALAGVKPPDAAPAEGPPPMTHPAVLVIRAPTGNPNEEQILIQPINNIDALSIPTVLRKAASLKEQELGL